MTLRDQISVDAGTIFTNPDDFGESIVYRRHQYYGQPEPEPRTINAVVIRDDDLRGREIHVANDAAIGISADEFDSGNDTVEVPARDGREAETFTLTKILSQDHGMLHIECQ